MKIKWRISMMMVVAVAAVSYALPVTDGLIIHLEADRLVLEDGETVTIWPDSAILDSVDGTVKEDADAAEPTFKASAYNGMPAVHFDNVAQQALISDLWEWDNTKGVCMIILCTGGAAESDRVCHVGNVQGLVGKSFGADVSSDTTGAANTGSGIRWNNGWTLTAGTSPNPVVFGQWHKSIRQILPGGEYSSLFYAVDGVAKIELESNNPTNTVNFDVINNVITVGNGRQNTATDWVGGTDWYYGDVAEVIVYNTDLTEAQMQQVLDYLDDKYNRVTAHYPTPANGATNQGAPATGQVEVTVTWSTGLDASGAAVNSSITEHRLYITTDPNFPETLTPIVIPAGDPTEATASYGPIALPLDKTVFWRVDEVPATDPVIVGPVWSFETLSSVPTILGQPVDQKAFINETAALTIEAVSVSALTYEWFRSEDNATDTPDDDLSVGAGATLTVPDVQVADEGYYYCTLVNDAGSVNSAIARLGVKRPVAHWTLDLADFVGGQYLDSSGEGHHADPGVQPDPSQFVAGPTAAANEALDLTVEPLAAAQAGAWEPAEFTDEITVSAWINVSELGAIQGVITKRNDTLPSSWIWQIDQSGVLDFRNQGLSAPYPQYDLSGDLGQWLHVAVAASRESTVFYVNGMEVDRSGGWLPQTTDSAILIGANNLVGGIIGPVLAGAIDDARIYNYALTDLEIVDELYYPISGTPVCLFPDILDVAGGGAAGDEPDCQINLADFAAMLTEWLDCGIYPASECQ